MSSKQDNTPTPSSPKSQSNNFAKKIGIFALVVIVLIGICTGGFIFYKKSNQPTKEELAAIKYAQKYSEIFTPSAKKLYEQLTIHKKKKISKKVASYAVANAKINWNNNALVRAKLYVQNQGNNILNFSKYGLYKQLASKDGDKFTKSQANYAVTHIKVNWKKNALGYAKDYVKDISISKAALYQKIMDKNGGGFSKDEANYAIKHIQVNWNKEALKAAQEDKKYKMSRSEIKADLTNKNTNQFTKSQANYALAHLN